MKKCLLVCGSFYPAFKSGGPVRSVTNLVKLLKDDIVFYVFTADRDMGSNVPFDNINVNSWNNKFANSNVFYKSPCYSLFRNFKKIFINNDFDIIYLNSFFDFNFSIVFSVLISFRMFNEKEILLAPRGELTQGAMSLKPLKKKLFLTLFKVFRLHKNITFHFTSKEELEESIFFLGDVKYNLAPNMHGDLPVYKIKEKQVDSLNIIFLSRISPKKNLLTIIESLKNIKFGNVNFTIAGVVDDHVYWDKCCSLLRLLPSNIKVNILGPIDRHQVTIELSKSHLFFLPTLNENYGHAIVEAMMYSNIVMLSDKTPWSEVSSFGGFIGGVNDIDYYTKCITYLLTINKDEFNDKTNKIFEFSDSILKYNEKVIKEMFN
ncbi:glycosyltransferase [Shewanella sp. TB4-MNA-CIBAN-0142]|uniref:glycosyltransferase n=1 Tax=Shewanella sp. TB4-MNA-CIBAN-0142 TaxID=3140464 RepID=UPI00331DD281